MTGKIPGIPPYKYHPDSRCHRTVVVGIRAKIKFGPCTAVLSLVNSLRLIVASRGHNRESVT